MGAQFASAHSALNMKLLVVLALAAIAAAEPEAEAKADPYLLYGGYGVGHYGYGLGYHGLGYRGYYYGKREATTVLDTGSTTARGKLRLSPRLPLIPTCCTDTAMAMVATGPTATPTAMAITTARGMLRLRLIPTSMAATTAMDSATATATVLATGDTTMDKLL